MQRMFRPALVSPQPSRRHGFTTPAVAVALLAIMLGLALILDRIWLETVRLELRTVAEAAALAGASELANDTLLQPSVTSNMRLNNALQTAGWIAEQNYVAGSTVALNCDPEGDVRVGYLYQDTTGWRFEESTSNLSTVVVTASRTRAGNNPIALVLSGFSQSPFVDVVARAEATVSNDVVGLRATQDLSIPALPIAILQADPNGQRQDTWDNAIVARQGGDQYMFDYESNAVVSGADGIPEITLSSLRVGGDPAATNMLLVDLGTGLIDLEVTRQFQSGICYDDLQDLDENIYGQLWVGQGASLSLTGSPKFDGALSSGFQSLIGQRRVCFLYSTAAPQRQQPLVTATCPEVVAIRIMAVTANGDGSCDVTVQPTVMTVRSAMLASESLNTVTPTTSDTLQGALSSNVSDQLCNSPANCSTNNNSPTISNVNPNQYVYKLRLTQ